MESQCSWESYVPAPECGDISKFVERPFKLEYAGHLVTTIYYGRSTMVEEFWLSIFGIGGWKVNNETVGVVGFWEKDIRIQGKLGAF